MQSENIELNLNYYSINCIAMHFAFIVINGVFKWKLSCIHF